MIQDSHPIPEPCPLRPLPPRPIGYVHGIFSWARRCCLWPLVP
jgi:hypothetical protein